MKRVKLSGKESWITLEELNDPDVECWLVRVPQHDSLKRNLLEKAIPLATKNVKPTPVMGSYVMNVRSMPHNKGIVGPSTEALPTLAFRGQNKKGKARLQFGPQFSKFVSVEFRMPMQRNKAPPPPRVYPKVPDGLHVRFPLAGKSWGRTSTGSSRKEEEEAPEPTVDEREPVHSVSAVGAEITLASTETNGLGAKKIQDEEEIQPAPTSEVREILKVAEMHDESKDKEGSDLNEVDRNATPKESVKNEAVLSSPPKRVAEQANANESIGLDVLDASKQQKKNRTKKKGESELNEASKSKHDESTRKKRKKRKSENAELQSGDAKDSKKEELEVEKNISKEEPATASVGRSSKKKKRRRSDTDGDSEKKKKRKKESVEV